MPDAKAKRKGRHASQHDDDDDQQDRGHAALLHSGLPHANLDQAFDLLGGLARHRALQVQPNGGHLFEPWV